MTRSARGTDVRSDLHDLLEQTFRLALIVERAGARMGMREGSTPILHEAHEVTLLHQVLAAGEFRKLRKACKDAAARLDSGKE
jgi:hypothetical protein